MRDLDEAGIRAEVLRLAAELPTVDGFQSGGSQPSKPESETKNDNNSHDGESKSTVALTPRTQANKFQNMTKVDLNQSLLRAQALSC